MMKTMAVVLMMIGASAYKTKNDDESRRRRLRQQKDWVETKHMLDQGRRLVEGGGVSCVPDELTVVGCDAQTIIDAVDAAVEGGCDYLDNDESRAQLTESCNAIKAYLDDQETYNLATPTARLRPMIEDEEELTIYYDGGGELNEKRDRGGRTNLQQVGKKIKEVYDSYAQDERLAYPRIYQFHQDDTYVDTDPDLVYPNCANNAWMCCFSSDRQANDNNGNCAEPYEENCVDADPADNTDICYSDHSRSPRSSRTAAGLSIFEGDEEGDAHCHGFTWSDDKYEDQARFAGNNLFYISMYDHLYTRGYVQNIPGAPMCGCLERMPTVSRADCTELDVQETFALEFDCGELVSGKRTKLAIAFNACDGGDSGNANDLESEIASYYDGEFPEELRKYITGPIDNNEESNCQAAIDALDTA